MTAPLSAANYPPNALDNLEVRWQPNWLSDTRQMLVMHLGGRPVVICWSFEVLAQMMRGVMWHDWPDHCPTWVSESTSGACRCDLGGDA